MVMNFNKSVNGINLDKFNSLIPDEDLRTRIIDAYFSQNMQEHDIIVVTDKSEELKSTFTATAVVQLTNQSWVQCIKPWNVARMC